jgi:hypothetical protein
VKKQSIEWDGKTIMVNGYVKISKEIVVAYFRILFRNSSVQLRKTNKNTI